MEHCGQTAAASQSPSIEVLWLRPQPDMPQSLGLLGMCVACHTSQGNPRLHCSSGLYCPAREYILWAEHAPVPGSLGFSVAQLVVCNLINYKYDKNTHHSWVNYHVKVDSTLKSTQMRPLHTIWKLQKCLSVAVSKGGGGLQVERESRKGHPLITISGQVLQLPPNIVALLCRFCIFCLTWYVSQINVCIK